ncbi:N-acyl-D-amino-acid deacylase family protein [Allopusillimonas ginsengisoli]|uniref:N-acyl-D-amino-acid deacylase family protein n=1 Tax=Allopusillimonas ginsengisoli TaxID=453575 RepID=UPI00101F563D|nr:amidohydrolase family protein [Allopusillimonas ginsengisoli]TEA79054.1 D-aminoacylase [Allopusillimonas ginsengisoli]
MYDLVIRRGTIVDGSGQPAFCGDLAISAGKIVQAGGKAGAGRREIDADGCLVTPGWVDIHTHYDGQATWDPYLSPSTWHGVTTAIMGNCGVGFAPVRQDRRDWLIKVMEGVEDIPGSVLSEGIEWEWETFPEYLDALARKPKALDIGAQLPHSALRAYVMGDRAIHHDEAAPQDLQDMRNLLRQAMDAGAMGFSTSKTFLHKYDERKYPPGTFATEEELMSLGTVLGEAGHGVFQMTANHPAMEQEMPWLGALARHNDLPVLFNLQQTDDAPDVWRQLMDQLEQARQQNIPLLGGISGRPLGILFSWQSSLHPFVAHPTFKVLQTLPFDEMIAQLRDPDVRRKLMGENAGLLDRRATTLFSSFHKIFPLGDEPDYEPREENSVAAMAARTGRQPLDIVYDLMLEKEGKAFLYYPSFNYAYGHLNHVHEMLQHDNTVNSLSDGGAHCGYICDVSLPTFMLSYWTRDRKRGDTLPLERVVKRQTADTARVYGLHDRGTLMPGFKADINVIDPAMLKLHGPEMVFDLPAGGRRLVQRADGYVATLVNGEPIFEHGQSTGSLPGRLLRSRKGGIHA